MLTADFDYSLPPELIAQSPSVRRDQSRLLILDRATSECAHRHFRDLLDYVISGDVLVLNNTRVIPARLRGLNAKSGGRFEILLLEEINPNDWWAMMRPGKRAPVGTQITLISGAGQPVELRATVIATNLGGHRRLRFDGPTDLRESLELLGEIPLPPYITRKDSSHREVDRARYQTVYARHEGSVAAPTAGLHFTRPLLEELRARGVKVCFLTLHVGAGTFAPVKSVTLDAHEMHEERFDLGAETVQTILAAKASARRIIAVGTTTTRVLESVAAQNRGHLVPGAGRTNIFIYPPHHFKVVDGQLTNFHLPCSTLLMLVSAFAAPGERCGVKTVLSAYAEAVRLRYRFFSYGDAMLIL